MFLNESILVIEDEQAIAQLLEDTLLSEGYRVTNAVSVTKAYNALELEKPNLILLDWMLPDDDGVRFFRRLRASQNFCDIPVIMLTARNSDSDQAYALDQGVEDFIAKPFTRKSLLARVRAVLRRSVTDTTLIQEDWLFDVKQHRLSYKGKSLKLYPKEARILALFMSNPGRVYSREDLLTKLNKGVYFIEIRTIDVHISRLRKRLKQLGNSPIRTVRGSGYMFET